MNPARVFVDVSDLPAPEPLAVATAAASRLAAAEYLQIHHWREPLLLYPRLARNDFEWETRMRPDGTYEVFVWRTHDIVAGNAARAAARALAPARK